MKKVLKTLVITSMVAIILCASSIFVRAEIDYEIRALASWLDSNSIEAAAWLKVNLTKEQYAALLELFRPAKTPEETKQLLEQAATELVSKGVPTTDKAITDLTVRVDAIQIEIDAAKPVELETPVDEEQPK